MPTGEDNVPDFMRVKHETPAIFHQYDVAQAKAERIRAAELAAFDTLERIARDDGVEKFDLVTCSTFVVDRDSHEYRNWAAEAVRNLKAARGEGK